MHDIRIFWTAFVNSNVRVKYFRKQYYYAYHMVLVLTIFNKNENRASIFWLLSLAVVRELSHIFKRALSVNERLLFVCQVRFPA